MQIHPCSAIAGSRHLIFDHTLFPEPPWHLFDAGYIIQNKMFQSTRPGRGAVWFFHCQGMNLVWRHFHRGGVLHKILRDQYLRTKVENSRSWREWQFLSWLYSRNLPVPRPVAAQVQLGSILYRADLITSQIPGAISLAAALRKGPLSDSVWQSIGQTIALFHAQGVWHSDLNAHNIVFEQGGRIFILDFDRSSLSWAPGSQQKNLQRLLRSLRKLRKTESYFAFQEANWPVLLQGYYNKRPAVE